MTAPSRQLDSEIPDPAQAETTEVREPTAYQPVEREPNPTPSRSRFAKYWFSLLVQPLIVILFVGGLAWLFGYLQRHHNWFNDASSSTEKVVVEEDSRYACSMLCVFVDAPGRCPVCGMELQAIKNSGDPKDIYGLTIEPAARRLANIKTVVALNQPQPKWTEALGRVTYDETTKTTVSAWVDGRIEKLFVDYTGAEIRKDAELALLYTPELFTDQVGLLQAKKALTSAASVPRVQKANERLYASARLRLIEKGLPESELDSIEASGTPKRRLKIFAPASGTVIEKLVDEGSYVSTGTPLFRIANLKTVWLVLELPPESATNLKLGQGVNVEIQSQAGRMYAGKVSFIAPMVDLETRTVSVRVEIPNDAGLIKIGDLGRAKLRTAPASTEQLVVVPREAVLVNGSDSIAYVQTKPGRYEFRKVRIAEFLGDKVSISEGILPGEQVVASGAFMLDSDFNIRGKVSLIDPNRVLPADQNQIAKEDAESKEIEQAFASLSPDDRKLAEAQIICPVTEVKLGTLGMGAPIRIHLEQRDVMICCAGCESKLKQEPQKYLAILETFAAESNRKH